MPIVYNTTWKLLITDEDEQKAEAKRRAPSFIEDTFDNKDVESKKSEGYEYYICDLIEEALKS